MALANPDLNPPISPLLRGVTWLEVAILAWAGGGLLLYPPSVATVWPWSLTPFNARYLGALYAAAIIAALMQASSGRWSPARIVTPMIFIFTLVVTIFSFVHIERFNMARIDSWIWFALYIGVCLNAGIHLWLYRRLPRSSAPHAETAGAQLLLSIQIGAFAAYGIAMLAIPEIASRTWPWKVDAFHAHLYSVTFITPALGAWLLLRGGDRNEWLTLGLTQAAWGLLPIVGLLIVDSPSRPVPWTSVATWAWIALFVVMFALGAWMIVRSRRTNDDATVPGRLTGQ